MDKAFIQFHGNFCLPCQNCECNLKVINTKKILTRRNTSAIKAPFLEEFLLCRPYSQRNYFHVVARLKSIRTTSGQCKCTITCSRVVGILNVHDVLYWIGYILLGSTRKGVILREISSRIRLTCGIQSLQLILS